MKDIHWKSTKNIKRTLPKLRSIAMFTKMYLELEINKICIKWYHNHLKNRKFIWGSIYQYINIKKNIIRFKIGIKYFLMKWIAQNDIQPGNYSKQI